MMHRVMLRFYRALLRLYPAGFLADYRHELCAAFAERMREYSGPLAPVRIALAAIADVVPNAAAAHADMLRRDLRYAARSLGRAPGFAATAVLLVALGVGANTAAFSLADLVLVRPLPYPNAERLVKVWERTADYGRREMSPANFRDLKAAGLTSLAAFEALARDAANLAAGAGSEPRRLEIVRVTAGLFPLVGTPALLGHALTRADSVQSGDRLVVLSYALWQSQFGGEGDVVGKVVRLDGAPYTVIGVMPPEFRFPDRRAEAWAPLTFTETDLADRTDTYLEGVARLREGASVERAREELAVAAARLAQQYKENDGTSVGVFRLREELSARARLLVLALCGAALCILLLACANLASLLLARGAHRARELAVRAALGAGRDRLVRQLVTESVALAAAGGAVGVAVAAAGVSLLARFGPNALPVAARPAVDARVLAVAVVVVAVTGLLFGVLPAVRTGARSVFDALRDGGRTSGGRTQRLRAGLVIVEVAASVVLLVSSGLLIRAVWRIQGEDPGFRTAGVLTLRTALPLPAYATVARREQFYARVLHDVRALPGVKDAAYTTGVPMRMGGGIWAIELPGESDAKAPKRNVGIRFVTPGYFATLGIPLRRGRDVAESDTQDRDAWVAVVSESFARRYLPPGDPIGRRFGVAFAERTVVGVVGDVRVRGLERPSEPQVYFPYKQVADSALPPYVPKDLVVRTSLPTEAVTAALLPAVRRAVRAADAEQPISEVSTLADVVAAETAPRVTQLRLLATLSAIALLIAGVGIHGLLTYMVTLRSQELAVRRALGAQAGSVAGLVLREGVVLAVAGIAVGVAAAYPSARAMGALLAGVEPADPLTLGAVAALCLATAALGCLRPALRAARVAPQEALRAG